MAYEFKSHRTVEFSETDMAGIMHFTNFFRYMEFAEHAFFRSLGLKLHTHSEAGIRGWARGSAECTFRQPLRYEDNVEIHVLVKEKRPKSLSYLFVFRKQEPNTVGGLIEVARGSLTVVCVTKTPGESVFRAATMPAEIDAAIEAAPPELLT